MKIYADCIVETDDYVYIFEFKRDKSAEEALQQIEDTGYAKPYEADKRTILKVGVNFDSKDRTIDGWKVAQ
ncbi:MAG: PD-(D/E)XK nuclease domain-containing protein [Lachnospiraceae bacterium]|nr:PD-(D/E)XK nuclease domain-containing protein [Lachnospiraceae bacterium]